MDEGKKLKKYEIINRDIKTQIENKVYLPGDQLPTEAEIMKNYSVSRITVQKAINDLKKIGYVERTSGKGTFVTYKIDDDEQSKNRTVTIIIMYDTQDALETISGIESILSAKGVRISLGISRGNIIKEREMLKNAIDTKSEGLIVYAINGNKNMDIFDELIVNEYPLILIDKPPFHIDCSLVSSDSFIGGYKIAQNFIKNGHERFVFIGYEIEEIQTIKRRYEGFKFGLKKHNIDEKSCTVIEYENLFSGLEKHFANNIKPTAIFCANDIIAFSAIRYLNSMGLKIPQDISVAGFDDNIASANFIPALTTVKQDYFKIGTEAGNIMIDKIFNHLKANKQIFIPTEFIERESVSYVGSKTERKL